MSEMPTYGYGSARVPISLSLPAHIVEKVERYAHENNVRKTDAYLHLIISGLEALGPHAKTLQTEKNQLSSIQSQLGEILALLKPTDSQEAEREQELAAVKSSVARAAAAFPAILRAYLFGSFARGSFGPASDVDIRVEIDRDQRFNLHDLTHFAKQIEQETEREVDVVSATTIKNANLAAAIEREKVLVYERAQ